MPEEREKKGAKRVILPVLGVMILFIAVVVIAGIFGSDAPIKPILTSVIEARAETDPVQRSKLISNLDDYVKQSENPVLTEQWNKVLGCLGTRCPDEAFSDTIFVVAKEYQNEFPKSDLIMNIIAINRFWNDPERVLEFSKATTTVDKAISEIGNRRILNTWKEIVDCNGKCPEYNDLFFKLIDEIIKYS